MISINSSSISTMLQNLLRTHTNSFNTSLQRLMTGLKINSPADDQAGFYVSNQFLTQIRGLESVSKNIQSGIDLIEVADTSAEEINTIMSQIRTIVAESCNEYLTPEERQANQAKINELFAQAKNIKENTKYNGLDVLNGVQVLDRNTTYTNNKSSSAVPIAHTVSMNNQDNGISAASFTDGDLAETLQTEQNSTSISNEVQTFALASSTTPPPPRRKCQWQPKFTGLGRRDWNIDNLFNVA